MLYLDLIYFLSNNCSDKNLIMGEIMKFLLILCTVFMVSCASNSKNHVCKDDSCHKADERESVLFTQDIPDFMWRG